MSFLLKNTKSITVSPPSIESVDLRIHNGKISERGKNLLPKRGEELFDLKGKVVTPGFVCAHTHLYSSLSRGMPMPADPPRNFLEILQKIWWKLDRALDDEAIYYSALVGSIDTIRCGTTTLIDHHASPKSIKGSLDIIKQALGEVGLRGVLCYEVTDRDGKKERDQGLAENERFIRANKRNANFRGLVGAHAAFTLSNDSLRLCGELAAKYKTGVHIHVAEDKCDVIDAEENYRCSVVERLLQHKILKKESILAHCVHLSPTDFSKISNAKCWLVHNPRSNMNNRVGYAPVHLFGERAAMGTDGFPTDMFEEARTGYLRNREGRFKFQDSNDRLEVGGLRFENVSLPNMLNNGQRLISEIFGEKFGTLEKGSAADFIVVDYNSPTPMKNENLAGHFLFGMNSSMVESVMVGGKWVVKDREVIGVDVPEIFEKAGKAAKKLWERMKKI